MFNWPTYQRQYVQAVDMCAAAIVAHRVKNLPLKAIHLWPDMYKQFLGWQEKNMRRELLPDEKMEMDGVNIEMGTRQQKTPLLLELYIDDRTHIKEFEDFYNRTPGRKKPFYFKPNKKQTLQ